MSRYGLSPSVVGMRRVLQNEIKWERVSSWMENRRRMIRKALRMLSCILAVEDVASRGFLLSGQNREKEEQRSMSDAGWANP